MTKLKRPEVHRLAPSVVLTNPKYAHNVGAAVRALACFGGGFVSYSGDRVDLSKRLPREERMKDYENVKWFRDERPFDTWPELTPVAVELVPGAVPLQQFEHPENPMYVFGPEDGSLPKGSKVKCHHFIIIPTFHCTNLAAAVYMVLYDRAFKRWQAGIEDMPSLNEDRGPGWWHSHELELGAL